MHNYCLRVFNFNLLISIKQKINIEISSFHRRLWTNHNLAVSWLNNMNNPEDWWVWPQVHEGASCYWITLKYFTKILSCMNLYLSTSILIYNLFILGHIHWEFSGVFFLNLLFVGARKGHDNMWVRKAGRNEWGRLVERAIHSHHHKSQLAKHASSFIALSHQVPILFISVTLFHKLPHIPQHLPVQSFLLQVISF